MLIDAHIIDKLHRVLNRYDGYRWQVEDSVPAEMWETKEYRKQIPGDNEAWRSVEPGQKWGGDWVTAWFRTSFNAPESTLGLPLFLRAKTGGETLLFVDGAAMGVFDGNHPCVRLTGAAKAGHAYHVALETYAGHSFPGTQPNDTGTYYHPGGSRQFDGLELVTERTDVSAFVFDLGTLLQLFQVSPENSLRRGKVAACLAKVYAAVDLFPSDNGEAAWRPGLEKARTVMAPLLALHNSPTTPWIGVTGASHIDTAWLWPLRETRRKSARTFSSALNLMEQYPEFTFMQSAPVHARWVQEDYPELFARMQAAYRAGRWEPNGAMWLEPDCNIPSGESFARQLLVGQLAARAMFDGYTGDTLWLPDVFGYSAALPQLLRLAEVDFFCTTKMDWNDTNPFPYDSFRWQGIDGSQVVAHLNRHHLSPDPCTLTDTWNGVRHKDVTDRRYAAYGYGDGGGGPMYEMIEMSRRTADLEGVPRCVHVSLSNFMKGLRDDCPNLPTWVGELYLERHRGTLTSVAKIKRGNRKAEFALRDAELLSVLAGGVYPHDAFQGLWETLLTNQFHDILPGSSIAEVNDEAITTFGSIIAGANELSANALTGLGAQSDATDGLLLVNSLSWPRNGEVELTDLPAGMVPAGVVSQSFTDLDGTEKVAVSGLAVPPLAATVVPLEKAAETRDDSPFTVDEDAIETPHARVRFDQDGRIFSFIDKHADGGVGRQIVAESGSLNSFLMGQDVPTDWDNWDIDAEQALKQTATQRLLRRWVVSSGPLQLRVRSEYKVAAGCQITQDMVFHAESPQIDFDTVIDWSARHQLLKVGFQLAVEAESARHEIQYGHVERPTHQNTTRDRARFEVCAHKWSDLSDGAYGVALLNDCKYGLSVLGSDLRLTLIKSGTHPDPRADAGRHRVTYSLLPHNGGFSVEGVVRPAYELNISLIAANAPAGLVVDGESLVMPDAPNIIVEAVKATEKVDGTVVRLYEAGRAATTTNVALHSRFTSCDETNLLEEKAEPLIIEGGCVELVFHPFEVKTLVLR